MSRAPAGGRGPNRAGEERLDHGRAGDGSRQLMATPLAKSRAEKSIRQNWRAGLSGPRDRAAPRPARICHGPPPVRDSF